jgi:hypothetical protein
MLLLSWGIDLHAGMYNDFETFPSGDPIPSGHQLTDEFASEGVVFETPTGTVWAATVIHEGQYGCSNFGNSPINIVHVGGFGETTRIRFVHPDTAAQRLVRRVKLVLGDGNPDSESVNISVYDRFGVLLHTEGSVTLEAGYWFEFDAGSWDIAYVDLTLVPGSQSGAAFDDLHYDRPIDPGSTPGDVTGLLVENYDSVTEDLSISYDPTCAAIDHTIQYGLLEHVSTYEYSGQICGIGNSGEYSGFNLGVDSYFFLIVGSDGAHEGSYGEDSLGQERPPYDAASTCPYFQDLSGRCDIEPPR